MKTGTENFDALCSYACVLVHGPMQEEEKKGPRELKSSFTEAQIWVITGRVPIDQCMSRHVLQADAQETYISSSSAVKC